jgi:hypothetical protein
VTKSEKPKVRTKEENTRTSRKADQLVIKKTQHFKKSRDPLVELA